LIEPETLPQPRLRFLPAARGSPLNTGSRQPLCVRRLRPPPIRWSRFVERNYGLEIHKETRRVLHGLSRIEASFTFSSPLACELPCSRSGRTLEITLKKMELAHLDRYASPPAAQEMKSEVVLGIALVILERLRRLLRQQETRAQIFYGRERMVWYGSSITFLTFGGADKWKVVSGPSANTCPSNTFLPATTA
jgi:hypothetical protein